MKTIRPIMLAVALSLSVANADAQDDSNRQVKLGTGSRVLRDALIDWAQQTGYQIVLPSTDIVSQFLVNPSGGSLSPKAALHRLLAGTPLTFEWLDERTVAIRERPRQSVTNATWNMMQPVEPMRMPVAFAEEVGGVRSDAGASESAAAQSKRSDKSGSLEEIVVTAQKRQERLQDVPISISVLGGVDLEQATVDGISDALRRVPGTAISVDRSGTTQIIMRGVSASAVFANGSSPISYYFDSVPFGLVRNAVAPDANAYDLERVEVLRGPQGTLYGASALNGVVRVLTRDANLNEFELKARTSASTTKDGDESYRGDVAVNVPIVDGKLAARAVVGYQELGGWADRPNKPDANGGEIGNVRLKVNAQPTEHLSIGLMGWASRSDFDGMPTSDDNRRQVATNDEPLENEVDAYSLKLGYDFGSFDLTSMTSSLGYSNQNFLDLIVIGAQNVLFEQGLDSDVFSEELILSSSADGSWRWSLGGMYRTGEDRRISATHANGNRSVSQDQSDKSTSYAIFGEVTRFVLDRRLELTAGLRYFEDDVDTWENYNPAGLPLIQTNAKFDALTPRVVVTWHAGNELTMYASYAEGFRSGFDQGPAVKRSNPQFPPTDADMLTNYEVGAKGSLADGHLSFDAAVYYIDWQDVQQSLGVLAPPNPIPFTANVNGESASGYGVDLGLVATFGGLSIGLNGSWNDLTLDGQVNVQTAVGSVTLFEEGSRLAWSPEYTAGVFADYAFPLGRSGLEASFAAYANYMSAMYGPGVSAGVRVEFPGDELLVTGASFSVEGERWGATAFVDNLGDEDGSALNDIGAPTWSQRLRPRTTGLQLEYRF